jgi:broad specificity phosphatase PhoE
MFSQSYLMAKKGLIRAKEPKKAFIWFVRHAQAKGNGQNVFNGAREDSPLTLKGTAQAKRFAKECNLTPEIIYSSTLTRAVASARPFAKMRNLQPIYTDLAVEQDYGEYTGLSSKKLADMHAPGIFYDRRRDQTYAINPPGGESWAKMRKRAEKFLKMLDQRYAGKRVVVFSHSDFINCAYAVRFGLSDEQAFQRGDVPNCGVVRL